VSFYDMHVDKSSYFWRARKVINHQGTDLAAFARLIKRSVPQATAHWSHRPRRKRTTGTEP